MSSTTQARTHQIADISQQLRETVKLAMEACDLFGSDCPYVAQLCADAIHCADRLAAVILATTAKTDVTVGFLQAAA